MGANEWIEALTDFILLARLIAFTDLLRDLPFFSLVTVFVVVIVVGAVVILSDGRHRRQMFLPSTNFSIACSSLCI